MKKEDDEEFMRLLEELNDARERGDVEEEELLGLQCLAIASKHAEEDQSPWLRAVTHAHSLEGAKEWDLVELAYRDAVAAAKTEGLSGLIAKAHSDLSSHYARFGRDEEALREARSSVEAARGDVPIIMAMSLELLAGRYLAMGRVEEASQTVQELLDSIGAETMYDFQRARGRILRARCRIEIRDAASAREDLDAAWPILEPHAAPSIMAGYQSALAGWWEVDAMVRTLLGDGAGAARSMQKSVEYRRMVAMAPQLEGPGKHTSLAKSLRKLAVALRAIGDVEAADKAMSESDAILEAVGIQLE
jgi:hypothetical protein